MPSSSRQAVYLNLLVDELGHMFGGHAASRRGLHEHLHRYLKWCFVLTHLHRYLKWCFLLTHRQTVSKSDSPRLRSNSTYRRMLVKVIFALAGGYVDAIARILKSILELHLGNGVWKPHDLANEVAVKRIKLSCKAKHGVSR
jgi:hypothetical protein